MEQKTVKLYLYVGLKEAIKCIRKGIYEYLCKVHLALWRCYKIATGVIQTYVGDPP